MKLRNITLVIFIVAALMRAWELWSLPLWYDECFTLIVARLPLDRMMLAIQGDVHPPLWYLTVWPMIQLGAPAWSMRIPAFIFSMLSLWMFRNILRKLDFAEVPITIALFIMAVSPWQLYYAQEARMYSEFQFLILLAFDAVLERNWLRYSITSALMLYCQNYGAFFAVAIGIYAMIARWHDVVNVFLAGSAAALAYVPWLVGGLIPQMNYLREVGYWIGSVSTSNLGMLLLRFFWGMTIPGGFVIPGIYISVFITTCAMIYLLAKKPSGWQALVVMAFAPMALAGIVSLVSTPILLHRPLIASSPFLYAIVAYSFERVVDAPRRAQLFAAVFVIPALLLSPIGYMLNQSSVRGGNEMDRISAMIRAQWQPGDVIYVIGEGPTVNTRAYLPEKPLYRYPQCEPVTSYLSPETRRALGIIELPFDQVKAQRYWVMFGVVPFSPICERAFIEQITSSSAEELSKGSNPLMYGGLYLVQPK